MTSEPDRVIELIDDTRLNVASLLLEPVGSTRDIRIALRSFPLDDDLTARDVAATARLTRLKAHILVDAEVTGVIPLECAICLREYDHPFKEAFTESFRQSVDVRTGANLATERNELDTAGEDNEPGFTIGDDHEIDVAEALRQWILLAIPMQPNCGPDCPGPLLRSTDPEGTPDERFAQLADLLPENDPPLSGTGRD
ncbi:MAG TPA: DUF177 domain-containing protein [Thermomicrobiales bacterium]|nr:DUF177 domain-containing protein [Thermomicrobiales bacterium]